MKTFIAALLLLAPAALAQSADVEQLWLDPAGRGSLFVGNGRTLQQAEFRVGLALFYTRGNLRAVDGPATTDLVQDRFGFQVFGAIGLFDWLELGANVPVFVYQSKGGALDVAQAGLGNPWLHAKVNLLDAKKPVSLSVLLGAGIPVGTSAAQGNGGFAFHPRVQLGRVFDRWQFGVELGYLHRPLTDYTPVTGFAGDKVGSQVSLAAMAATVNESGPRGEIALRGFVPTTGGAAGIEAQLGFRWDVGPLEILASAGPGFAGDQTTPSVRAYAGVAFGNVKLTQPPCVEGSGYELTECPGLDRDGDGVTNGLDRAPLEPEDKDGFQDDDGAPELDNDGDGTADGDDACPLVSGPAANKGCPDTDADGDGIVDRLDACKDAAEDRDDFEDADGCPEADNDRDGFADANDACPREAGIEQEKGCPAKDSDQDQVFDHEDNCPQEPGVKENAGCPAEKKQLVVITKEALKILDKVFFDSGKATIQKRSNGLLDNVAQVLVVHPEIPLVQIEGHTDNVGKPEKNKKLSQERAEAVRAYLMKKGVEEKRVRAVGFGQEKPAQSNDTAAGKEANRRVEFNLVAP